MNFYNRYARGGSFGRKENAGSEFISPSSPAGLSSAAVVNKKKELKEGKALAGFGLTGHSGIHIQSEQDNPITRQKFENHLDSDPHRRVACPLRYD